jgi:hypothetical protein
MITVAMYSGRSPREKDVIVVFQEAYHGNWYASGVNL